MITKLIAYRHTKMKSSLHFSISGKTVPDSVIYKGRIITLAKYDSNGKDKPNKGQLTFPEVSCLAYNTPISLELDNSTTPPTLSLIDSEDDFLQQEEKAADVAIAEVENNPAFNDNPALVTIKTALKERKERVGQQRWSNGVRKEDAVKGVFTCVFTGDTTAIEAAHLNIPGQPYSQFGMSMRKDLAHRWDWTDKTMVKIEGGDVVLRMPGTSYDGLVAKMSPEKTAAVIIELRKMQGRV